MPNDHTPSLDQNPYSPYEETARYRAFRDGWRARCEQRPLTSSPYPLSYSTLVLAWLDGWMAARSRGRSSGRREQVFVKHRSGTERRVPSSRSQKHPRG